MQLNELLAYRFAEHYLDDLIREAERDRLARAAMPPKKNNRMPKVVTLPGRLAALFQRSQTSTTEAGS